MQKTGAAIYPRLTNEHGTVRLSTRKKGSRHRSLGKCSARERSIDLPKWGTHSPFLRPSLVGAKGFFFRLPQIFPTPPSPIPLLRICNPMEKVVLAPIKPRQGGVNRGLRHDRRVFLFFFLLLFRKFNAEQRRDLVIFKVPKSLWGLLNPFEWELIPLEMNFYWDSTGLEGLGVGEDEEFFFFFFLFLPILYCFFFFRVFFLWERLWDGFVTVVKR